MNAESKPAAPLILRGCLCIPTDNPPSSITDVLRDCLAQTRLPILVIDDGSPEPIKEILLRAGLKSSVDSGRLILHRLPQSQGKGAAIQIAFHLGVEHGFTHLLTLDGEGDSPHLARNVQRLLDIGCENPGDLIIGRRKQVSASVPASTQVGNKLSRFRARFQTGAPATDAQSGFRLYPLFQLQKMRFLTHRDDFEIEVLIRLLWKGVGLREVEIEGSTGPNPDRVRDVHNFWDKARHTGLHAVFALLSLLKRDRSPARTAMAFGLGIFVGCTPFFGLHSLIAVGLAVLFRLNFPLLLLGTQVSIPPLAPFVAIASIAIGDWLLGGKGVTNRQHDIHHSLRELFHHPNLHAAGSHLEAWLLGSTVLGILLGGGFGVLVYGLLSDDRAPLPVTARPPAATEHRAGPRNKPA